MNPMKIGARELGLEEPCLIVAELSANHRQDLAAARRLVEAASEAGADAVKLQTYRADTITLDADTPPFRVGGGTLWDGRRLFELYQEAHTPWEWHAELAALAQALGLLWFSTPFDETAVDFLEGLGCPAYKIASFELVDLPLLRRVARTGKPVVASTGMATLAEIEEAVTTLRAAGARALALLEANSGYPAEPSEMRLRNIPELARRFDVVPGLSDHTLGIAVPVAAVALGARVVEKHLTLARADGGPDAAFSLEPSEFREMVRAVRVAEAAVRTTAFGPTEREQASLAFRRSLFVAQDVAQGEIFTRANVRSVRPAHGLHTRHLEEVLGRRAARAIAKGTPLAWELVE